MLSNRKHTKRPDGEGLKLSEMKTRSTAAVSLKAPETKNTASQQLLLKLPLLEEINPLLAKNTCLACRAVDKRQVGPAYIKVAKRNYSNEKIVELTYNLNQTSKLA